MGAPRTLSPAEVGLCARYVKGLPRRPAWTTIGVLTRWAGIGQRSALQFLNLAARGGLGKMATPTPADPRKVRIVWSRDPRRALGELFDLGAKLGASPARPRRRALEHVEKYQVGDGPQEFRHPTTAPPLRAALIHARDALNEALRLLERA